MNKLYHFCKAFMIEKDGMNCANNSIQIANEITRDRLVRGEDIYLSLKK